MSESRELSCASACLESMFGLFKKDPRAKLEKQHRELLEAAFRMSKVDRTKADELTAKAAEVEAQLAKLNEE